jgi:hypothetical protein
MSEQQSGQIPPPPGWYADPNRAGASRWWDGQQWSDVPPQGRQVAPPAIQRQRRNSNFVIGGVALLVVGLVIAGVVDANSEQDCRNDAADRVLAGERFDISDC